MKKIIFILLSLIAFVSLAEAQTHNQDAGATVQGPQPLGHTTDGNDTINTAGKWGKFAVSTTGSQFVTTLDPSSGLTQSVIPVSSAAGLNGSLNSGNTYFTVGTDTIEAASTTTVLNLTAHAARVGDTVMPTAGTAGNINVAIPVCSVATNSVTLCYPLPATPSTDAVIIKRPTPQFAPLANAATAASDTIPPIAVRNEGAAAINTANTAYGNIAVTRAGAVEVVMNTAFNGTSGGKDIAADEDVAFAASDAVVKAGGVNNETLGTSFNTTNGDVTPVGVGRFGDLLSSPIFNANYGVLGAIVREDDGTANLQAGITPFTRADSAWTATSGVVGDNQMATTDLAGRLYVNPYTDTTRYWQGCGTATASTADVAIKAADASNRIFVTSITCASSDADNATNINFKDGSTVIAVGGVNQMATTSAGTFTATYGVPLRGTSNTAFNFNTAVSTSSVICCAAGFLATQ